MNDPQITLASNAILKALDATDFHTANPELRAAITKLIAEKDAAEKVLAGLLRCTAGHIHNQPYGVGRCPMCRLVESLDSEKKLREALQAVIAESDRSTDAYARARVVLAECRIFRRPDNVG